MDHRGAGESQQEPSGCKPCSGAQAMPASWLTLLGKMQPPQNIQLSFCKPWHVPCALARTTHHLRMCGAHQDIVAARRMSACCQGEATEWSQQVDCVGPKAGTVLNGPTHDKSTTKNMTV